MAAAPVHGDIQCRGGGHERAGSRGEMPERLRGCDVQRVGADQVAARLLECSFLEHEVSTPVALLARLQHEQNFSRELGLVRHEQVDGADRDRRVEVVTTGVHPAGNLGGVVETGVLLQRERVEVCAKHDGRARLLASDAHDRRSHRVRSDDLGAEFRDRGEHPLERLRRLQAEFRPAVDVAAHLAQRI